MKKLMIFIPFLLFCMIGKPLITHAQSDETKMIAFSNEADWKTIYTLHLDIMNRLIKSSYDLTTVDLSDENTFLNIVRLNRQEYLDMVTKSKEAAARLAEKYDIREECSICRQDASESIKQFQDIASNYQKNPEAFNTYQKSITSIDETAGETRCCGWRFYLCTTACAVTLEAFPLYLTCAAACFTRFCCKP